MKERFDIELYIRGVLDDLDPLVNGEERPTDLMDCGYVDGTWDALIILPSDVRLPVASSPLL